MIQIIMFDLNDPGQVTDFEILFSEKEYSIKVSHGVIYKDGGVVDDVSLFSLYLFRQGVNIGDEVFVSEMYRKISRFEGNGKDLPKFYTNLNEVESVANTSVRFTGTVTLRDSKSIPVLQLSAELKSDEEVKKYPILSVYLLRKFLVRRHESRMLDRVFEAILIIASDRFKAGDVRMDNQVDVAMGAMNAALGLLNGTNES